MHVSLSAPVAAGDLDEIKTVQISILARADQEDPQFSNNMTYITAGNDEWVVNDNYRRRFQIMTVELRNVNL